MDINLFKNLAFPVIVVDENHNLVWKNPKAEEDYKFGSIKCYDIIYNSYKPCLQTNENYICPVEKISEIKNKDTYSTIHIRKTSEGYKYFYIYALKYKNLFIEMHIDLDEIIKTFEMTTLSPEILFYTGPVLFLIFKGKDFSIKNISHNVNEILGYKENELIGKSVLGLIHKEDKEKFLENIKLGEQKNIEIRIKDKNGNFKWVLMHIAPTKNEIYKSILYYGYILDITETHEEHELFETVSELNPDGIILYDYVNNKIVYSNLAFSKITGYSKDEIKNIDPLSLFAEESLGKVKECIEEMKTGFKGVREEIVEIITKNGQRKWVKKITKRVKLKNKDLLLTIINDITPQIIYEKKLEKIANTDQLTGIYNRRYVLSFLEKLIEYSKRYNEPFSILIFDIDNFKKINDTYGHLKGDEVLKESAKIVNNALRKADIFGRWGGEEFLIILPKTDNPLKIAEKIRKKIENTDFGIPQKITISIGGTVFKGKGSLEEILQKADEALYEAKRKGKNQTVIKY